jgi:hypothetical protein
VHLAHLNKWPLASRGRLVIFHYGPVIAANVGCLQVLLSSRRPRWAAIASTLEEVMDAHRFDAFARALGAGSSRRALGRFLGGLALGGGIAVSVAERAAAKKKNKKKKKKKKKKDCPGGCPIGTCCDGKCANTPTDRNNCGACGNACGAAQYCSNAQCKPCETPRALCFVAGIEHCVDTMTDHDNCSACGVSCSDREVCRNGRCVCSGVNCPDGTCCPSGFEVCIGNGIGCCPNNSHYCGNGRCCPNGFTCGGSCGGECCG